jgi:hypothetical protein
MYTKFYASLTSVLQETASTRDNDGLYTPILHAAQSQSVNPDNTHYGRPLWAMVSDCTTMEGFKDALHMIDGFVKRFERSIPPPQTIQRQPPTGRSGSSLRLHAVMRGDLAHAWKRTEQVPTIGTQHCSFAIDADFHSRVTLEEVLRNNAATLALISLLERSGRRCDIYAVSHGPHTYDTTPDKQDYLIAVRLKAAGDMFSLHNTVCVTDLAFLRRLIFRHLENVPWSSTLNYSYGGTLPLSTVCRLVSKQWAIPSITAGLSWHDRLATNEQAEQWIADQIHTLTTPTS